jgi:MFS family permease
VSRLYTRSFNVAVLSILGFVLVNTLMVHYARWVAFLGGGVRDVGWIMGSGAVAGLLLRPWVGQWINRVGARRLWACGYGLYATAAFGNLLLEDLSWPIYALRFSLFLGEATVFAGSLTYVTQISPPDRRTEAIGISGAGGFIGMVIGPYLGDMILGGGGAVSDLSRSRADFTLLFVTAGAGIFLPLTLLLFLKAPEVATQPGAVRLRDFVRTVRSFWPGTVLLVIVVFGICMTVPFAFLSDYIDRTGLSIPGMSEVGLFFFCYAGWAVTVRVGLRRLPDRVGRRKVLLAGILLMGSGMFLFLTVDSAHPWRLLLPGVVCGTGHALMFYTMMSLGLGVFPDGVRGTGSALALMTMDLGYIGGPPFLSQLVAAFGYDALFMVAGSACFAAGLAYAASSIPVWRARYASRLTPQGGVRPCEDRVLESYIDKEVCREEP